MDNAQIRKALEDRYQEGYTAAAQSRDELTGKLCRALKQYRVGVCEQGKLMQAWDSARAAIIEQPDSDLPRIIFESVLEELVDIAFEALADAKAQGYGE